ncbi:hypothetical protein [Snodgrassella sp. CS2]|uniref:hypothetical protein n=1 Tax=Snodgrassella sp. CS2 TaxID=3418953 RepID=UPI003CFC3140
MSMYIISPRAKSFIFNYMRDNHVLWNHVPKNMTYSTISYYYENTFDIVDEMLKRIKDNLLENGVAAYEFSPWEMYSGHSQTLRIPNKYIKKFELYDKCDNVDNYHRVYVGKAVTMPEEKLKGF